MDCTAAYTYITEAWMGWGVKPGKWYMADRPGAEKKTSNPLRKWTILRSRNTFYTNKGA
jgi:hypothetical protein